MNYLPSRKNRIPLGTLAAAVLLLLLVTMLPTTANAETEGDFTYSVSGGKATIAKYTGSGGDVTIPDTLDGYPVTHIRWDAFRGCIGLTSVTIPDSTIGIGNYAFCGCTGLTSVTIPDSVTEIGDWAFADCSELTTVVIGNSVNTIGGFAFSSCTVLTSVTIPNSMTTIGDWAFSDCTGLTNVYYVGTEDQWEKIDIASRNEPLILAKIHCNHVHDYTLLPSVTVAATCTEEGYTEYTCIYGEAYRIKMSALGHLTGADTVITEPTCTAEGYTLSTCSRCGEHARTEFIDAIGHDYSGNEMVNAPTCTEQGYTAVQCVRCEEKERKEFTQALGHSMEVVPAVTPTCTEMGWTVGTACQMCGFVGVEQKPVDALGHKMQGGICMVCGAENVSDFTSDGQITDADAIYLLRNTLFPESYPLSGNGDVNCDGQITDADAIYLLRHTLFPDNYPLYPKKEEA